MGWNELVGLTLCRFEVGFLPRTDAVEVDGSDGRHWGWGLSDIVGTARRGDEMDGWGENVVSSEIRGWKGVICLT